MTTTDDPTRIRSIAVHRDDVATALEATLRTSSRVVLRVTPPFSGRMRARIHDANADSAAGSGTKTVDVDAETGAVHVQPAAFVSHVPAYPEPDDTAPAESVDVDRHHDRHVEAVETWRDAVRESIRDRIVLDVDGTDHEVAVVALGGS